MKIEKYHNWAMEKALRDNGLEQGGLAKLAGIAEGTISNIKRGRMRPTDEEEKKIAKALKMPRGELFNIEESATL